MEVTNRRGSNPLSLALLSSLGNEHTFLCLKTRPDQSSLSVSAYLRLPESFINLPLTGCLKLQASEVSVEVITSLFTVASEFQLEAVATGQRLRIVVDQFRSDSPQPTPWREHAAKLDVGCTLSLLHSRVCLPDLLGARKTSELQVPHRRK